MDANRWLALQRLAQRWCRHCDPGAGPRIESSPRTNRQTHDEVAQALEANDFPRVFSYIHPGATEGVARAKEELPSYRFLDARLTRQRSIEVNRLALPAAAVAEFNVAVEIERAG